MSGEGQKIGKGANVRTLRYMASSLLDHGLLQRSQALCGTLAAISDILQGSDQLHDCVGSIFHAV